MKRAVNEANAAVKAHICSLFDELAQHDGFGTLVVELKLLRRGQKEVILHCGKQYRYVIDFVSGEGGEHAVEVTPRSAIPSK